MPLLLLPHSQRNIHYSRGSKAQDPADIRAVRTTSNAASNRADPPRLTHREQGQNCTHDPSNRSGDPVRQLGAVVPSSKIIFVSASPNEMLYEDDRREWHDPVGADQQEVLHGYFEVVATSHCCGQEDDGPDERPDQARNDQEFLRDHLDAQTEKDFNEFAKSSSAFAIHAERCANEASDSACVVGVSEVGVCTEAESAHSGAEKFDKQLARQETTICPPERFAILRRLTHVDAIICRNRQPSDFEADDGGAER